MKSIFSVLNYNSRQVYVVTRLRLRARMGKDAAIGRMKRILVRNATSYNVLPNLCSIISGIPGRGIKVLKIRDIYLHQLGGGTRGDEAIQPKEKETAYPEPRMFGPLPSSGFFVPQCKNLEFSNVEIATEQLDHRSASWLKDVRRAAFFRVKTPPGALREFSL